MKNWRSRVIKLPLPPKTLAFLAVVSGTCPWGWPYRRLSVLHYIRTATVAQWSRALAQQAEGWMQICAKLS